MTPTKESVKQLIKAHVKLAEEPVRKIWAAGLTYNEPNSSYSTIEYYMMGYWNFEQLNPKYEVVKDEIEQLKALYRSFCDATGWTGYVPFSFAINDYSQKVKAYSQRLDATVRHIVHCLKAEEKERTLTPE
jgi:hypothetical protein